MIALTTFIMREDIIKQFEEKNENNHSKTLKEYNISNIQRCLLINIIGLKWYGFSHFCHLLIMQPTRTTEHTKTLNILANLTLSAKLNKSLKSNF